jgi:uncharacterized repeat protein (TIGR03803 family)
LKEKIVKKNLTMYISALTTFATLAIPFQLSAQEQQDDHSDRQTFTVLYTFTGGADGEFPSASPIRDWAGNLYSTTVNGGDDLSCSYSGIPGCGVVFKLDPTGKETALYTFTGGADGGVPSGLIRDREGNLYGTTLGGGSSSLPAGTVFKVDNTGHETVLHSFCSAANCADGNTPNAGVIRDEEGNLYGTTIGGGEFCIEQSGCGVVFKLDRAGQETVLYNFCPNGYGNCTDGSAPSSGLIRDAVGNLYGTTLGGGANGDGTVFKLDPTGRETVLHSFAGGADGSYVVAGLIRDEEGNLYGTTAGGGSGGGGTVFKVDPAGKEKVLYSFTGGTDGGWPNGLIRDEQGNLYGTTLFGGLAPASSPCGVSFCGVVFKLDPTGKETVLYSFTGGADGANPSAALLRDCAGNLYGTASSGGDLSCFPPYGCGVVFKLNAW